MKKSNLTKAILFALVGGCVVAVPGSVIPIYAIVKLLREAQDAPVPIPEESSPEKVRRSLYRLEENKYIKVKQIGKREFKFALTKKGKILLERYNFSDFIINTEQSWDGQWRIFVFDVPEKKRLVRDSLRKKLKQLGFFQFQKSVWIFPFECEEEMSYICEFLDASGYSLMFTGKIHKDQLLRKYFVREGILKKSDLKFY